MPRRRRGHYLRLNRYGLWEVAWLEDGRRVRSWSTGARDRAQADEALARFLARLSAKDTPAAKPLREIAAGYLADLRGRSRYWPEHRASLGHFLRHLGWLGYGEIRPRHAGLYAARRREEGASVGSLRQELRMGHAMLGWWAEKHELTAPRFRLPPEPEPRRRWLTEEEADRLEAACVAPHIRLFVAVALNTGARKGAILGLTWDRVDLEHLAVDFGPGSRQKLRAAVPINERLATALRAAREMATTSHVIEYGGRPVGQIERGFGRARAAAGLPEVTPHDLRRTAGSWMLQRGVRIELVAEMLGHRDIRTTRRVYAHLAVEHLREAAAALSRWSPNIRPK